MSKTILDQLLLSEENLMQGERQFHEAEIIEEELRKRREDGGLSYNDWRNTPDWYQWRAKQIESQGHQCANCGQQMRFSQVNYLSNGDFELNQDYPTVEHILPKYHFPDLALDKQNLVMTCWACNKSKGSSVVTASRLRHQLLMQKFFQGCGNLKHALDNG